MGTSATIREHIAQIVLVALLTASVCANASAIDKRRTLDQFFHTAWTADQGAPESAQNLTQTTDGYLWLGTSTGLVRFDGVRFEHYGAPRFSDLPSSDISALMATPDGGLWIGYRTGGASFLKGEQVLNYGEREGLPSAQIFAFALAPDGFAWVATSRGLERLEKSRWNPIGADWNFTSTFPNALLVDRQGRMWAVAPDAVYILPPHTHSFRVLKKKAVNEPLLMQTPDGMVWVVLEEPSLGSLGKVAEPAPGQGEPVEPAKPVDSAPASGCSMSLVVCAASDGSVWMGTVGNGVSRIPNTEWLKRNGIKSESNAPRRFTREEGLSGNDCVAFLEDREGNVWVSTRTGLDRFRRKNVYPAPSAAGSFDSDVSLVADKDGVIWLGAENKPLLRIQNDLVSALGKSRHIVSIYRDRIGTIWLGGWGTLTRLAKNRLEDVQLPKELEPVTGRPYWKVRAITDDRNGALWISAVQHGVFRLRNNLWEQYGHLAGLPRLTAFTLWSDSGGRVWFGYTDNRIGLADGEKVRTFSSAEGLHVGTVRAFGGQGAHVWAGGQFGLARFDGNRFSMLTTEADGDFRGISGIVETDNGDLWLNQASGLAHIPAAEVETKIHDSQHPLRYELFDSRDGLRGTASQMNFLPSAVLGTDGRIWVSGSEGPAWIDTARIYRNALPPPVSIQSLTVDGRTYPATAKIELPALPSNLQISYTALSLSVPERVRFRYKLEGQDKDWQNVGTRRGAFYTNLGPGIYRFRVIACNNDGVWNETGAAMDFSIAPAFYQTSWFILLCLALLFTVLWLAYLYRLNYLTAQIHERLGARLEERERIARELHDTLLQGFQGLMLRFQGVLKTLPANDPAHQRMEQVLNRADEVLLEGRQRVRELRAEGTTGNDLPDDLARYGTELAQDHGSVFSVTVVGTPYLLDPTVRSEARQIGREGMANAFQHAQAAKIEVEITYSSANVSIRIRDDGAGIDTAILSKGRAGHWGLSGMRERAQKIGAKLSIWSHPGKGTEIDLWIPANLAYPRTLKRSRWHRVKLAPTQAKEDREP
jgi:ligand-binding sensor domain-containing protein